MKKKKESSGTSSAGELAEQKLIESEARYKRITDCLTDYLYTVKVEDGKAVETIHNDACFTVTGYTSQDFLNDPHLWINMIPPEERENVASRFAKVLSAQDHPPIEHRIICKDGRIRWVIDTTIPKYDSDGKLISYDGVIKDITTRKQAEETLKLRETYLTAIIENQPGLVWLKDRDGRFLAANSAFLLSCGKNSADELLGKTDLDIWPKEHAEKYRADDIQVITQKKSIHVEEQIFDMNQVKWFETYKTPILDENGEVVGTTGFAQDITDRKQAEYELISKDILLNLTGSTAKVGGWEIDVDTLKTIWTEEVYRIYEVDFTFDPNVSKGIIFYAPNSLPIIENAVRQAIEFGEPFNLELEFISAKGNHKWVHSIGKVVRENGKTKKVFGSIQDISDRRNAEQIGKQAEIAIRENNELLTRFLHYSPIYSYIKEVTPTSSRVLYASQNFHEMIGFNNDYMIGKTMSELFPPDFAAKITADDWAVISNGKVLKLDEELNGRSYTTIKFPINLESKTFLAGYTIDMTERKDAEEKTSASEEMFRHMFQYSATGMVLVSPNFKFLRVNDSFCKMLGYSEQELLEKTFQDVTFPDDRALGGELVRSVLSGETETFHFEKRYLNKDGSIIWGFVNASLLRDSNNNPLSLVAQIQDITERKKTEEALSLERNQLRTLIDNLPDSVCIYIKDSDCRYVVNNHAHLRSLGLNSQAEALGKTSFHFFTSDEAQRFYDDEKEVIQTGKALIEKEELVNHKMDGEIRWHLTTKVPLHNSAGVVIGLVGMSIDITERKRAEEALIKSEEKFSKAFRMSPEAISISSMSNGKYIDVNDEFCRITGFQKEEIVGHTSIELNFWLNADERQKFFNKLSQKGFLKNFSTQYRMRSGEIRDFIVSSEIVEIYGEKCGLNFILDITESKLTEQALKSSEEKFRKAFVVSPDSININRLSDGKFVLINQGFTRIMGYEENEVIGKSSIDFNIWKNIEDRKKLVEGLLNYGNVENLEAEFCAKDGSTKYGLMSATIIDLNNEKHILSMTREISDRKQIEAELEKHRNHLEELVKERTKELNLANNELRIMIEKEKEFELILQESLEKEKELSEIKSRFISTTSHEFRTPLTSILSSAEMIQRYANQWSNERKNEHLERIKNSVAYLTKLLDDILTISKTETGKIQYQPENIDLYNFAEECANETRSVLSSAHELKLNFVSGRREFLLDAKLMKFILNNLLSNAAKYSPEGGAVQLTISSSERYLIVEVRDEGIGIPVEETDKIFDSFYRSKNAENIAGTGLGLAIVKRAVDLHEGEITVRSQPGKGTTFIVKIPIQTI